MINKLLSIWNCEVGGKGSVFLRIKICLSWFPAKLQVVSKNENSNVVGNEKIHNFSIYTFLYITSKFVWKIAINLRFLFLSITKTFFFSIFIEFYLKIHNYIIFVYLLKQKKNYLTLQSKSHPSNHHFFQN